MADIKMETPGFTLIKPEDSVNQQLIPVQQESVKQEETDQRDSAQTVTDKEVTDSDLIVLENNQALTTSLKVAECFGKQHSHVMRAVEKAIENVVVIGQSKNGPADLGFIAGTYEDQQGKNRPLYYLNRDAFTFVVMGFTGEKAATWKWRYIQAFNRMEEELRRRQENKPMTSLEILQHQVTVMTEHERHLKEHDSLISQVQADIKQIKQNNNGMFLRHEMADIRQQQQLDQHETDIQKLQRVISDKGPREEIKTLISAVVTKTADTTEPYSYKEAYEVLYKYIRDEKKIRLSTKLTNLKRLRSEQGWSKAKIEKLSCLDAIDADPAIWGAIRDAVKELWIFLEERTHG